MKKLNQILGILPTLLFSIAFGMVFSMFVPAVNPFVPMAVLFAASFIPASDGMVGALSAGIRREAFKRDVQENLFAGNPHVNIGINDSGNANDVTINIPQAGANPNVEINRAVTPATVQDRGDTNLSYDMDEFTTDPFKISAKDKVELNYSKRMSLIGQHIDTINNQIGLQAGVNYATDTTIRQVRTTGALSATALAPGATGTRKSLVKEDIRSLAQIFDADQVPDDGRFLTVDSDMYWQLFDDPTMTNRDHIGDPKLPKGVINELFGFKIMKRSKIVIFDNAFSKKAVGSATAVTDNLGAIAFHKNSVSWAQTTIDIMLREQSVNPEWYATIMSALVRYGSSIRRTDEKGIASLIQEA